MSKLIETARFASSATGTRVRFERDGGTQYLILDDRPAYELTFMCDTCSFTFERMYGANEMSITEMRELLQSGLGRLDSRLIDRASTVLPAGKYIASMLEIRPTFVEPLGPNDYFSHEQIELWGIDPFWGLPHHPKIEYYRCLTMDIGEGRGMFEFIVPMVPKRWLNQETCKSYGGSISNGKQPTALAISVLDRKRPVMWQGKPLFTEHWCLAHFLLDGHHKTYVASQLNKPITLLSFLAIDESISSEAEIDEVLEILRTVDNPRSNDLGTGQC